MGSISFGQLSIRSWPGQLLGKGKANQENEQLSAMVEEVSDSLEWSLQHCQFTSCRQAMFMIGQLNIIKMPILPQIKLQIQCNQNLIGYYVKIDKLIFMEILGAKNSNGKVKEE